MSKSLKSWFKDSETIFWARLKTMLGSALLVLSQADPGPLFALAHLDQKWLPAWQLFFAFLAADGVSSELLRRRRDPDMR